MKTELILLSESYEKSPIIKSLVQLIPGGGSVDSYLTTKLNNMKAERMKIFFDKLQSGQQELSENIIETNDFLHAYFCTVDYVLRTKSEDKIKRFAEILLGLAANKINFNEFEEYISVFNELSDREFSLLFLKYQYEQKYLPEEGETEYRVNGEVQNPKQITNLYWKDFKEEVINKIGIKPEDFNPMLIRIQRTGCYSTHKGYWDEQLEEDGNTTSLFKIIIELVTE